MKTFKYILWLIILGLLGILIYQNLDYFMTTVALKFDLKISTWHWTIPELQNIVYFGICFFLGLILIGAKGFFTKLGLKKEIKTKEATITSLKEQINTLKTELEVFQHDPYINKALEEKQSTQEPIQVQPEIKEGDNLDTAD